MLKKTITYKDLDGNDVTEDFYFNLNKAEIAEMELSHKGGFSGYLQSIIDSQDGAEIIATFKKIITTAVGKRSEDNRRFMKSEEITNDFLQTEAYSQLFMELVTNGNAAVQFVQAIMPSDLVEAYAKGEKLTALPEPKDETPAYILEDREPTNAELMAMTPDQVREAFMRKQQRHPSGN